MFARRVELCSTFQPHVDICYHCSPGAITYRRSSHPLPAEACSGNFTSGTSASNGTNSLVFRSCPRCWLIRPEVRDSKPLAERLRKLRDENLAEIDKLVAEEKEFDREFCRRYYREHLRFGFGEKEKEGLQAFASLCAKHRLLPTRNFTFDVV